jgi:hypothetical protein
MLFARQSASAALNEELRFHLERQIDENVAAGMSPEEARYAALRMFGNPALMRDQTRATWSWNWLESLGRDLRIAVRTLVRTPVFAAIAIGVMALGIGATVAQFTVVRSVLLKPLPFQDPDRLTAVFESQVTDESLKDNVVAPGSFAEWRERNHSFASLALYGEAEMGLSGSGGQLPELLHGEQCTWNLLSTLGVKPALGRDFTQSDDRPSANGVVILSWGLWKRRFGADPGIVNQTIRMNGQTYSVIGVMPAWFAFPTPAVQLWTPAYKYTPADRMQSLGAHQFFVVGRLMPGATLAQAGADLAHVLRQMLGDGLRPAIFGLVIGLAASAGVTRLIEAMLFKTQPLDPWVFSLVAALLLTAATLACLAPAWRASRLNPMTALRME